MFCGLLFVFGRVYMCCVVYCLSLGGFRCGVWFIVFRRV